MKHDHRSFVVLVCVLAVTRVAFAATNDESLITEIYEQIAPSVVLISIQGVLVDTESLSVVPFQGSGSGFAIRPGLVATNYHVIEYATRIEVTLADERSAKASVVGTAPEYDLALLRVPFDESRLPPAESGSTHLVRIGQTIVAVGNPLGLQHSLSTGVISGLHREIPGLDLGATLVQFDAAINPGQSGGPLVDLSGRVIGMTTAKASKAEAIGFAIPIELIERSIPDLIEMGHPFWPQIGFDGMSIDPDLARLFELPTEWGILIESVVEGSVAAEIGLTAGEKRIRLGGHLFVLGGDIIVGVNDEPIRRASDLTIRLASASPGQKMVLAVVGPSGTRRLTLVIPEMEHR